MTITFFLVRFVALIMALCLLESPLAAAAPAKQPKISVLTPAERQWEGAAFRDALLSLGYIERANFSIDVRSAAGKLERMAELAAQLIHSDVDLIVAVNTPGARAATDR